MCNCLCIISDGNFKVCLFGNVEVLFCDILCKGNYGELIEDGGFDGKNGRFIVDL